MNWQKLKKLWQTLGPGFITGASDDDPSGIATYSQTGSLFGYHQLWTALFSYPFMTVVQEMCGRIGLVTGKGLAAVIRRYYPKPVLYFAIGLLFLANTINIGADLGAMAAAGQLLLGVPYWLWLIAITAITLTLEIFVSYRNYARVLKYLTLSLFAYIITVFIVKQNWAEIFYATLVPTIIYNKAYLLNVVAILGTTISPYLFFWQASEEVEEEVIKHQLRDVDVGTPKITEHDVTTMRMDTIVGMLFSNLVMFFIIATAASTLGRHGITSIDTAAQAAEALRPLAGNLAFLLFAAGIIGTGLLAVPILAGSASYALSEAFHWHAGLNKKFRQAHGFYGVIILATLIGLLINFTGIQPFQMLYYTAIFNGISAPPLLFLILLIANNPKIMNGHTNSIFSNLMGGLITVLMALAAAGLLLTAWK